MAKPLDTADFRAIRILLEPDDFAVSDGKPDGPTDLVDKETWHGIVDLPDDVSIRTSNHQGKALKELYALQATWTSHAVGDDQGLLFEVLLYSIDELDAALFNALHGFYRQAIGCLRNIVELVLFGTHCQMAQDTTIFKQWQVGHYENSFGGACTLLRQHAPVQALNAFLRSTVNDTIIDRRNAPQSGGWARSRSLPRCTCSRSTLRYSGRGKKPVLSIRSTG